jgi:hypothetical protein
MKTDPLKIFSLSLSGGIDIKNLFQSSLLEFRTEIDLRKITSFSTLDFSEIKIWNCSFT